MEEIIVSAREKHRFCFIIPALSIVLSACNGDSLVVQTFPIDGGVIATTARVGAVFAEPMDPESVESNFHLEPRIAGHFLWENNVMWFVPETPFLANTVYTAILESKAATQDGMKLSRPLRWQFEIRQPTIVFLTGIEGKTSLWQQQMTESNDDPRISPELDGEILAYAFGSGGNKLIYVVANEAGGSDLWWSSREGSPSRMLVDCGRDRCAEPAWSENAQRIAYSRASSNEAVVSMFDPPMVWTVAPSSGQTSELLNDDHALIGGPSWSPSGDYLAFYDGLVNGIRILDLAHGEDSVLPSGYGVIGSWSPDSDRMVFPVLRAQNGGFSISLHQVAPTNQETAVIVGEDARWLDFGRPVWSPDGTWIVVGIQSAEYGPGKQLWLVKPDGSELHPIVIDPAFTHGGYRWDPYGKSILFQRFHLNDPAATPEVWLWSMENGQSELIAENAWQPDWLP